ncbi:Scr1 family TA system antitoxin-like transcriptional regulator [Streptomyces sp. NPDC047046]|uniref:Scr1 family TA system antitoxin-like transcriptional regulator n=1 Tax=Streptomyces sp. NPDC047046 TaxID=3155378 RepID=UPI0033EB00EA
MLLHHVRCVRNRAPALPSLWIMWCGPLTGEGRAMSVSCLDKNSPPRRRVRPAARPADAVSGPRRGHDRCSGRPRDPEAAAVLRRCRVQASTERQQILQDASKSFSIVLEETVLHYQLGDRPLMIEQLSRILTVSGYSNVSIGIIPRSTPRAGM